MFISEGTQIPVNCVEHAAVGGLFYFLSREDCFISHALFITIIIPAETSPVLENISLFYFPFRAVIYFLPIFPYCWWIARSTDRQTADRFSFPIREVLK